MTKNRYSKRVTKRVSESGVTYFVALPVEAHVPIKGGCNCPHCKAHPDQTPMWDTLSIGAESAYAITVHYPDLPR